jgi:hypothetical protein
MTSKRDLQPLRPILVAQLFADLGEELVAVEPDRQIRGDEDLIEFLDELNRRWVVASQRLSPRLITDLIEFAEPKLSDVMLALDAWIPARFPVSWAGEEESQVWLDIARELSERWLHQQQIRHATKTLALSDPRFSRPVLETFLRALPHQYALVAASEGTAVSIQIQGDETYSYRLVRVGDRWELFHGVLDESATQIALSEGVAWRLFTKGMDPSEGRRRAQVEGNEDLAQPYFETIAVMA